MQILQAKVSTELANKGSRIGIYLPEERKAIFMIEQRTRLVFVRSPGKVGPLSAFFEIVTPPIIQKKNGWMMNDR